MANPPRSQVSRLIHTLFDLGVTRDLTDGQLLERFATARAEAAELAFAALVERHGPMVLRTCRALLPDPHDADDAFQATFLVLVRRARALWVRETLGPWLHQVACRTARGARAAAARRRRLERAAPMPVAVDEGPPLDDLNRVLHEELERLPERFRAPLVLCDLEGRTHDQAARHLGWPVGTIKSRIARGRDRLRARLRRRGLGLGLVVPPWPVVPVSTALTEQTTRAAVAALSSRALAGSAAAVLATEVLAAMSMTRWWKLAATLLTLGGAVSSAGILAQAPARPKDDAPAAEVKKDDVAVTEVKQGHFSVALQERGFVEGLQPGHVINQVEGSARIVSLVREGTRVTKGQVIGELDASALKDQLVNQEITTRSAEATYENAKLTREVAALAVDEYQKGQFSLERASAQGEAAAAAEMLKRAEARLERTRKARQALQEAPPDGPRSSSILAKLDLDDRVDVAEMDVMRQKLSIEQAHSRLKLLEQYTAPRTVHDLKAAVERARDEELTKQSAWELEKSKEAKLRRQIESCKLVAPNDGLVEYGGVRNHSGSSLLGEGAIVGERDIVARVIDLGGMGVNVKVREGYVDQVAPGQRVNVVIDAFPGETLSGTVVSVASLPDQPRADNLAATQYTTMVKLERSPARLRPGMSAIALIEAAPPREALTVPLSSVIGIRGNSVVAVKRPDGGFDWRAVTLGETDGKVYEVKSGLKAGEAVAVDPRSLPSGENGARKLPPK